MDDTLPVQALLQGICFLHFVCTWGFFPHSFWKTLAHCVLCWNISHVFFFFGSSKSWLGNMETGNLMDWIKFTEEEKKDNTAIEMMRYCGCIVVSGLAFSLGWMNWHGNDNVHQSEEPIVFNERIMLNERIRNFLKGLYLECSLIGKSLSSSNLQEFPQWDKPKRQE